VVLLLGLSLAFTSAKSPCESFSLSECDGDTNAVYLQINTSREKCQQYCAIEEDCLFYRFAEQPVQGVNCLLYKEPFYVFTSHCNIRAGPKNPSQKCLSPSEDSCEIVQNSKCIYYGTTLEHFDVGLEECIALCEINPSCQLWTHNEESKRCELLDSAEASCNEVFGPSSYVPAECGEHVPTTTTDAHPSTGPTPPVPIDCPADSALTLIADQDWCGSYWECFRGTLTRMTCENCYLFDEVNKWCSPPEFVDCGTRPHDENCQATTAPGDCPYPYGYFKDPDDCTKYIICEEGTPRTLTCPKKADENNQIIQLLYNYDAVQCDWPYRVSCEDRPICDENYQNCQCQGAEEADPDQPCPDETGLFIVANPFNCAIYYICESGVLSDTIVCEEGQYFDPGSYSCVASPAICGNRPICSTMEDVNNCKCYLEEESENN